MPTYEMALLLRVLPKVETASVLKRAASVIFEKGGFIRKLENLGTRGMPFKTSKHGTVHKEASYFYFEFDFPPDKVVELGNLYSLDIDIIRKRIYKEEVPDKYECTLEEEMQPAPYRQEVQKMIEVGKKKALKKQFKYNSGLDYYPFQK